MNKLMTIGEASRILRCNPETLRRHDSKGTIKCKRDSYGNRYLTEEDIQVMRDVLLPK